MIRTCCQTRRNRRHLMRVTLRRVPFDGRIDWPETNYQYMVNNTVGNRCISKVIFVALPSIWNWFRSRSSLGPLELVPFRFLFRFFKPQIVPIILHPFKFRQFRQQGLPPVL